MTEDGQRKEVSRRMLDGAMPAVRVIRLNYDVLAGVHRDNAKGLPCMYCWHPMDVPTWDHVIPRSKGGPNTRGNLVVVCRSCNEGKGNLSLPDFEGYLLGIGAEQGRKVTAFTQWITRDWTDDEKGEYSRLVAAAWAMVTRDQTRPSDEWPADVRNALSKLLRTVVEKETATKPLKSSVERKPYTLRDLRRRT